MKRLFLIIVSALICGMVLLLASSCNKESNTKSTLNIKADVKSSSSVKSTLAETKEVDMLLWCQGSNIDWYNETTGELKLKEQIPTRFTTDDSDYFEVFYMYLGDELLFKLAPISVIKSTMHNYPVLIEDINEDNDDPKYYIGRGYPNWEYWTDKFWTDTNWDKAENAHWVELRELNWNAIKSEWNKFIEYLKEEGKYIE